MQSSIKVAILGAHGFVGSELIKSARRFPGLEIIGISRYDDWKTNLKPAEVIIHAANSGKRYWAGTHPDLDFHQTVNSSYDFFETFPEKKWILISTLSARTQPHHPYGKHRRCVEDLYLSKPQNLVIRLGPMYGGNKSNGPLYDLIYGRPVFVGPQSSYAFTPVEYNARKTLECLDQSGLIELGPQHGLVLGELSRHLQSTSNFESDWDDTQIPINPPADAPPVEAVYDYVEEFYVKNPTH